MSSAPPTLREQRSVVGCAYFFKYGYCSNGSACEYSHANWARPQPCHFYSRGLGCTRGANCRFLHVEQKTIIWKCPVEQTGWIIGKNGVTIDTIRKETAATIRSSNDDGDSTTFIVSGAKTSVDLALALLNDHRAAHPETKEKRKREDDEADGEQRNKRRRMDPKPHRCSICGKRFKLIQGLTSHTRSKHGSVPGLAAAAAAAATVITPAAAPPPRRYDYDDDESVGPFGFSASDTEDLLCQGVKPWEADAHAVLAALSGDY